MSHSVVRDVSPQIAEASSSPFSLAESSLLIFGLVVVSVVICVGASFLIRKWPLSQGPLSRCWFNICASYFGVITGSTFVLQAAVRGWFAGWLGSIMSTLCISLVVVIHALCGSKVANITSYGGSTYSYFIRRRLGPTLSLIYGVWGVFLSFTIIASELRNAAYLASTIDPSMTAWKSVWILNTSTCLLCVLLLSRWRFTFRSSMIFFLASIGICCVSIVVAIVQITNTLPNSAMEAAASFGRREQPGSYFCLLFAKHFLTTLFHPFLWTLLYSSKDTPSWQLGILSGGSGAVALAFIASITGLITWGANQSQVFLTPVDVPVVAVILNPGLRALMLSGAFSLSVLCVLCAAGGCVAAAQSLLYENGLSKRLAYPLLYLILCCALLMRFFAEDVTPELENLVVYGSALLAPAFLLSLWPVVSTEGCSWGVGAGALVICCFGWTYNHSFADGFKWWFRRSCIEDTISYTASECFSSWITIASAQIVTTVWILAYSQWQFKLYPQIYEAQVRRLMIIQAMSPTDPLLRPSQGISVPSSTPADRLSDMWFVSDSCSAPAPPPFSTKELTAGMYYSRRDFRWSSDRGALTEVQVQPSSSEKDSHHTEEYQGVCGIV